MPKRPTKQPTNAPQGAKNTRANAPQGPSAWKQMAEFLRSDNFRIISAILLLAAMVLSLLAYVSYFFTGASDQSVLFSSEMKNQVSNVLGVVGARLAEWLVNGLFGISSLALIVMGLLYGLHMLHILHLSCWKIFFCSFFALIWGSITFAFLDEVLPIDWFFRLGGAHGDWLVKWLNLNIHPTGTFALIMVSLLVFMLLASDKTLPMLKRFYLWFIDLFRKPVHNYEDRSMFDEPADVPVAEPIDLSENIGVPVDVVVEDSQTGNEVQIDIEGLTQVETEPVSTDDLKFEIEGQMLEEPQDTVSEEELQIPTVEEEPEVPSVDENPEDKEDAGLTIEKPKDVEILENDPEYILKTQGPYDPRAELAHYNFPSLDLLKVYDNENSPIIDQEEQKANATRIVNTLRNYGVEIESIKATVGPTVTLYEVVPKAGVRIAKIQSLESDIMLSLSAVGIRIIAPMPGKGTVGIEVPNVNPQIVSMHSVIASKKFQENVKMRLPIALGRTITNDIFMFDLAKTPHLLVAGATGQGKSVAINAIITSLLYKKHPAEMKMVLVDPKMVEFAPYKPLLKHYLAAMPGMEDNDVIITDCSKVVDTLNSLVIEMENRYKLLMDAGVRNLEEYNDKFVSRRLNPQKLVADSLHHQYLPYIVIVIDEYGDFIMQAGKQVETPIARITQKARAVGMHMILATQRPSVNIVTGVIKANIPTRIALRTQSVVDSRTVLDAKGADQLIGRGDLLYSGSGEITRIQCAFVDTPEVDAVVSHVEHQQSYFGPYELPEYVGENGGDAEVLAPGAVDLKKLDPMFRDVATYVVNSQQGSTSIIQRKFQIGYNRAGKLSDQLEAAGIVGPNKGAKGRDVLIQDDVTLQAKFRELGV